MKKYLNFQLETTIKELKEKVVTSFQQAVKDSSIPDEDGLYNNASLESSIENCISSYFEEKYKDMDEEQFNKLYDIIFEKLSSMLNDDELMEDMLPVPPDYYGLTESQRNSGLY